MASQKSSAPAVAPKRQRGRDRVAAIMDAGVAVFVEKGYEAATMTEIAARAGAAIGSLYRFFPTKEALADALVARYGDALLNGFAEIEARAGEMPPAELAAALIEAIQSLQPERAAAVALIDARPVAFEARANLRHALRERVAAILAKAAPGLSPGEVRTAALLVLHLLKSLRALRAEGVADDAALAREGRALVALYLAHLGRAPAGA
jgi:AcrR family transcriptional regulator